MTMLSRITALAASLVLVVAACASAAPTSTTMAEPLSDSFIGADGVAADIADTSRIITLNGDITEIVFALGAGDRVIGIDLTTTYPQEALSLPTVGLGRTLTPEGVIGLSPSLVIGDTQVAQNSAIEQIRAAGIPVAIINAESTLPGVSRKIGTIAAILDLEDAGRSLAAEVDSEIAEALALASTATSEPSAGYVYVRGPETLLMFGNGMPTHFLIEAAGATDALGEVGVLFAEPLNAEILVAAAPEYLITPTQGFEIIGGLDSFLSLPGIRGTPAGSEPNILTYDEAIFLGMGPRVGQALMQLVIDLHPELTE
jgi:iron complex transport system substrate-binding protein